jgi:hypothetical protein
MRSCTHPQVRATSCAKLNELGGAVAQLGARLDGIEEVVGSNPIGSTNLPLYGPKTSFTDCSGDIAKPCLRNVL